MRRERARGALVVGAFAALAWLLAVAVGLALFGLGVVALTRVTEVAFVALSVFAVGMGAERGRQHLAETRRD